MAELAHATKREIELAMARVKRAKELIATVRTARLDQKPWLTVSDLAGKLRASCINACGRHCSRSRLHGSANFAS